MLTMTTGIDDNVPDQFCDEPQCLQYKAEPGTRWAYHTGVYGLLIDVIEAVTGKNVNQFINQYTANPIGMKGIWASTGSGELYFTNVRSMARFGLLTLNNGVWDSNNLLNDPNYFYQMISTSQELNKSYGYLWWLNGKSSFKLPGLQIDFPGSIIPNAPDDMQMALGKNGQIICVIPSQNIVMVRMGLPPDGSGALVTPAYLREIWTELNKVICNTSSKNEEAQVASISLFPNPVVNALTIKIGQNDFQKGAIVEITNVAGQKVISKVLTDARSMINTSELITGVYFATVKDEKGIVFGETKFVKE